MRFHQAVGDEMPLRHLGAGHIAQWTQGQRVNQLRDWTRAMAVIRQCEVEGEPPKIGERTTIEVWKEAFLQDAKSPSGRNLGSEAYRKYVLLFKQLEAFAANKGLRHVDQMDLPASKKLERLRNVLKFGAAQEMAQGKRC
jgi:hypothetical protein